MKLLAKIYGKSRIQKHLIVCEQSKHTYRLIIKKKKILPYIQMSITNFE